jgi:uncharacterized membrane protein
MNLKWLLSSFASSLKLEWDSRAGPVVSVFLGGRELRLALICHREESRCIKIGSHRSFLCARCTGLCVGLGASFFLRLLRLAPFMYFPQWIGLLLGLPLMVDGSSQLLGIRESTNSIRLVSGFLFSLGIFTLLVR